MRRILVLIACVVCVVCPRTARGQLLVNAPRAGEPAWATAISPGLLTTRQKVFNLPFRMLPPPAGFSQPVEVQLFISTDRGTHWTFYDRRRPFDGAFAFQATNDGEYWFVSQIVDQAHRAYPKHTGPEVRVIVDTQPPRLQLSATVDSVGRMSAQWRVEDTMPASDSLRLEWRAGLNEPWIVAPLSGGVPARVSGGLPTGVLTGQTFWLANQPITQAFVRARIQDTAGNIAEIIQPVSPANAPPQVAVAQPPSDPFNARRQRPSGVGGPVPSVRNSASVAWPENEAEYLSDRAAGQRPIANTSVPLDPSTAHTRVAVNTPANANNGAPQPTPPDNASHLLAASHRLGEEPPLPTGPTAADAPPPGEQPRVTNSRRLHLEYDVASVGSEGVAKVELWSTRDGGRSWRPWGLDPDRESPMLVALEDDGVYGFRIVITAGNGLAGTAPQPGEPADLWVDIDSTTPTGRITSAKYGRAALAGKLVIQWEANDLQLTDRPISLYHRAADQERWTPIVKGAPHSGSFIWAVGAHIPKQVFLRLEIRDKAGNVGVHELTDPVSLEGLIPKARIRGVRPVATLPFETSRRRFFR